jgi:hypothetical protein
LYLKSIPFYNIYIQMGLMLLEKVIAQHSLPLTPSSPRRRLYEPEATRGEGIFVDDIKIFPHPENSLEAPLGRFSGDPG